MMSILHRYKNPLASRYALSSASRINRADDAAGLSISGKIHPQGLAQGT